jgi:pyridinium-3,5-biscarboxylic acid mononucleotide sulfurtransferase
MRETDNKLFGWFVGRTGVLTALSGGVDSCLVAWAARQVLPKLQAIAVIGDSPSLKRRDLDIAIKFCDEHDIYYEVIRPGEIDDPNYKANPVDRCFWCKSNLYTTMVSFRDANYPEFIMVNGNNKSDWSDYRPGLKAADKYQSYSPLAEVGMTKEDIRDMAREAGLKVWDKPASPCLSSRFPYGESITVDKLALVEKAEESLFSYGFTDARVRYFGTEAKIEVPAFQIGMLNDKIEVIAEEFKKLGFTNTLVDEEGLVSGKLNRVLNRS